MNLYVYTNKQGKVFYYVKHSYRDKNGKSTSRIVEKLGTHEELLRLHDDPKAWALEYVAELNRREVEKAQPVTVTYSPTKQISEQDGTLYYGGYLFLQKIFYELGLEKTCKAISKKHKFEYDLSDILSKLIYHYNDKRKREYI